MAIPASAAASSGRHIDAAIAARTDVGHDPGPCSVWRACPADAAQDNTTAILIFHPINTECHHPPSGGHMPGKQLWGDGPGLPAPPRDAGPKTLT